ncbi:Ribosomal RNA small subunit methyltransferase I [Buchnera aphidicola (Takecallis arundicolens)]|uniref:16S rRNA (cytidine(1402)-2'-O)-methyltransferase n=1 Tax=Buchnera aphidicola TaxID=9 RepID=UPI00346451EB
MNKKTNTGILYVVATPIGNIQDITYRAVNILQKVQLIAAEDTRHTKYILETFQITTKMTSLHQYNESYKTNKIIFLLKTMNIALVSNAGTPTIHDPGYILVQSCHKNNIQVVPIPGPCALIAALSASGLPSNNFYYKGFLPRKTLLRKKILLKTKNIQQTIVFYESCHRILHSMKDIVNYLGRNRIIVLVKEITKKWETIKYGPASDILLWLQQDHTRKKGEMVIVISGIKLHKKTIPLNVHNTLSVLIKQLTLKQAIQLTSLIHKTNKNQIYTYAIQNFIHDKK